MVVTVKSDKTFIGMPRITRPAQTKSCPKILQAVYVLDLYVVITKIAVHPTFMDKIPV
jgi:hypothetical protein